MKYLKATPKNEFEALRFLTNCRQELEKALNIMNSCVSYTEKEGVEVQRRMMEEFLKTYK